jgi:hypothetical protein
MTIKRLQKRQNQIQYSEYQNLLDKMRQNQLQR